MTRLNDVLMNLTAPTTNAGTRGTAMFSGAALATGNDAFGGLFSQNLLQSGSSSDAERPAFGIAAFSNSGEQSAEVSLLELMIGQSQPEVTDGVPPAEQMTLKSILAGAREQVELRRQQRSESVSLEAREETPSRSTLRRIIWEVTGVGFNQLENAEADPRLAPVHAVANPTDEPFLLSNFAFPAPRGPEVAFESLPVGTEPFTSARPRIPSVGSEIGQTILSPSQPNVVETFVASSTTSPSAPSVAPVVAQPQTPPASSALILDQTLHVAGRDEERVGQPVPLAPLTSNSERAAPSAQRDIGNFGLNTAAPATPNLRTSEQVIQTASASLATSVTSSNDTYSSKINRPTEFLERMPAEVKPLAKKASSSITSAQGFVHSNRTPEHQILSAPPTEQPLSQNSTSPAAAVELSGLSEFDQIAAASVDSSVEEPVEAASIASYTPLETETPEWEMSLIERISANLKESGARIELALTPETLGKLEVQMELSDGRAEVTFVTETKEAAKLLSQAEGRLADLLARNGFSLGGQDTASRDGAHHHSSQTSPRMSQEDANPQDPSNGPPSTLGSLNLIA